MAVIAVFEGPGVSAAQYDGIIQALDAQDLTHPDGRLFHCAYAVPDGWRVVDVWDSPEKLMAFGQVLMPIMATVGVNITPQVYPAHHLINDQATERVGL